MLRPLARDTAPAAEARHIAFFQQRQPHERLAITFDLTAFSVASSRDAIRRAHPSLFRENAAAAVGLSLLLRESGLTYGAGHPHRAVLPDKPRDHVHSVVAYNTVRYRSRSRCCCEYVT